MAKSVITRTGRCIGGDVVLTCELNSLHTNSQYKYEIRVYTYYRKNILHLKLKDFTLDQAKQKFYDVYANVVGLIETTEDLQNE